MINSANTVTLISTVKNQHYFISIASNDLDSKNKLIQGFLDDLDATLVSEVYISRPSSIYSFYSIEYQ